MNRETFQGLIRRILKEEVEKQASTNPEETIYNRLPEVVHDKDYKKITPHERDNRTKDELLDDLTKVVKAINSTIVVGWDDHDDISIDNTRDMFRIRIIPKWENSYSIEAFTRNEDRVFITGQTWKQVKEFVKKNLKGEAKTTTDKALEKSEKNREDNTPTNDKGMPQKDKPKILPLTNKDSKSEKTKDKNYTEKPKDNDDLPEKPMKEVKTDDIKRQIDHKVKDPVKLRKRTPDKKLIVKQS